MKDILVKNQLRKEKEKKRGKILAFVKFYSIGNFSLFKMSKFET